MDVSADLEIGLHHLEENSYAIELRFTVSNDQAFPDPVKGVATFDFERLLGATTDPITYGKLLSHSLFADAQVLSRYREARQTAERISVPLHLRLFIWPGALRLHELYWEMLSDPKNGELLATDQNILFSRFLTSSTDRRRLRLRARSDLKALIAIANPSLAQDEFSFDGSSLAAIDEQGELDRALTALAGLRVETLPARSITLEHLVEVLGQGYDIVYLVAHGGFSNKEPVILLEDGAGGAKPASGGALVTRIRELQERPLLMVLASCQSAAMGTSNDDGALASLGPLLAEAGVPAVLAMQGNISMRTVARFMPVFFSQLKQHGQIDRAVATARGGIREYPDFWMPALFSRLQGGRIWYSPGFVLSSDDDFTGWDSVLENIEYEQCTPILGSGMLEELIGPTWALAQSWAEQYGYPMSPGDMDDLPQVAQYLAASQQQITPKRQLINHLRMELLRRFGYYLPKDIDPEDVGQVVESAGRYLRSLHSDEPVATRHVEPHAVLASLPFKVYVTTNPDTLLFDALGDAGKTPTFKICRWNDDRDWPKDLWQIDPDYVPDEANPLVYYLFGHIKVPLSLVIKEDDYFDYLVGVTSNKKRIPSVVREALSQNALLFLGFKQEDWDFRTLFRFLVTGQKGGLLDEYNHVAAQVDPEEGAYANPQGARNYLKRYFRNERISIYWGRVDDFTSELQERWAAREAAKRSAAHG
ncbi:MAG TPA: CHAT domain-containing protein [Chloroflexia bacterium]|nr:CHAT domain-containing protein [Chloroflexia bacterium]